MNPKLKSTIAVLAGFITVLILHMGTDLILDAAGIFPPPKDGLFITWMLLLALGYRSLFNVVGGYVTALLAPSNPVRHAFILGCLGTVGGAAGVVAGWDLSPHWYPIALMIGALPTCWMGGWLKAGKATVANQPSGSF